MGRNLIDLIFIFCEWVMRLTVINLLWILFSALGLGIFGIAPSTVAACSVINNWINGNTDIQIFSTFKKSFKENFIESNKLGIPLIFVGMILIIDFYIISLTLNGWIALLLFFLLVQITLFYLIILLYSFPVFIHYKVSIWKCLKISFIIGILNPVYTSLMLINLIAFPFILLLLPGLIPFFSFSTFTFLIMYLAHCSFKKNLIVLES